MSGTSLLDTIKKTVLVAPHPAGIPFIGGGVVAALIFFTFSSFLAFVAIVFTVFCLYFFRDPARVVPQKSSLVLSGADGLVSAVVGDVSLPPEMAGGDETRYTRISTFLSVLDVHVQRAPVSGKIIRKIYSPGKFFNADLDKASEDNERCSLLIETPSGQKICVVQIAGLIARRIINDAREDESINAGHRFGMIRFGSRVDIYIPEGISPLVCVGQRAIGGETVFADLDGDEAPRDGVLI
ncbi:MAG: phosphatidylserine decarboxylase family protein [Micavibrio aeruginosavorus]|uniref:Phosphatidylserine decarboxylase proenzyme n=1 Tax=Micavibrio aeruginosavorus TaxID=349221 RepID=A0A2W5N2B0_9BACT|nr:MAG: phosphatidylserine decarboxylase family protein [Micavibrio aeruginosavorus]